MHTMLERDPQKRITIEQVKMHPWMNGPIPSLEQVQEQMNERISIVFNKTLEELRLKIETKGLTKKDKPHTRSLSNIEGLKSKYHKLVLDINQQIQRKIQNVKKQKILLKQAQPETKENIPHPLEECLLKQNEDYIIEFQDQQHLQNQSQQQQPLQQESNGKGNVAASLLYSPIHFSILPTQNLLEKEAPFSLKNSNLGLIKSISGNLEESKQDSKPAHVEEDEYNVAPIKKYSWQSKDDSYFSTNQKPSKIAAVQFNDDLYFLGNQQFEILNSTSPPSTELLKTDLPKVNEFGRVTTINNLGRQEISQNSIDCQNKNQLNLTNSPRSSEQQLNYLEYPNEENETQIQQNSQQPIHNQSSLAS